MTRLSLSGLGEAAPHQPAHVQDRETERAVIPRGRLRRLHDAVQLERGNTGAVRKQRPGGERQTVWS